jgi:hypothetical protein
MEGDRAYAYYLARHQRDGWDGQGAPFTLHGNSSVACDGYFGANPCNAGAWISPEHPEWLGRISVGQGSECTDIIAHEYTHVVTFSEYTPLDMSLRCSMQNALNEGVGDAMAEFTQAYWNDGVTDWLIGGAGECSQCGYLRSLQAPALIPIKCDAPSVNCGGPDQFMAPPDNFANYRADCEGHFNSTVISKSAYLMGRDPTDIQAPHWGITNNGLGEEKASKVWYRVITDLLPAYPTFTQFRNATISSCGYYLTGTDYSNCVNAIEAVGLWTGDGSVDLNVDRVISKAYFPAAGHTSWRFHKGNGTTALYYAYQLCYPPPINFCYWSTPQTLSYTSDGPTSAVAGGYLWVCYRSTGGSLWCDRMDGNGSWSAGPDPGGDIVGSPSLARWGSSLYVAYRKSNGSLYWRSWNGGNWSSELSTLFGSPSEPTLASTDEDPYPGGTSKLWLAYRDGGVVKYSYLYFHLYLGWRWSTPMVMGQADQQSLAITSGRAAAAMFRGRLHVATGDAPKMWYASCQMPCSSSSHWTRIVEQDWSIGGDPYLEAHGSNNGRLNLWHRLHNPDGPPPALYVRSKSSQ